MMTLVLPQEHTSGWGVCDKYLTRELARLAPVQLVAPPFDMQAIGDEFAYHELQQLTVEQDSDAFQSHEVTLGPVLQAVTDHTLLPMLPEVRGRRNIGYTFFEHSTLSRQSLDNARDYFDVVVAGSTWCQDILRQHGVPHTATVFQGVDPSLFNMYENHILPTTLWCFLAGNWRSVKGRISSYGPFTSCKSAIKKMYCWSTPGSIIVP